MDGFIPLDKYDRLGETDDMIEPIRVVAILLAAGRGRRFGGDKLRADFGGIAIGKRAAAPLLDFDFARRIVVVGAYPLELDGFEPVQVLPDQPMGASIAAGVGVAARMRCDACLIALADMPFVSKDHFGALLDRHGGGITASSCNGRAMVPAIFDRAHFGQLQSLTGDGGARDMLRSAVTISATHVVLADIDEPGDLARFERNTEPS